MTSVARPLWWQTAMIDPAEAPARCVLSATQHKIVSGSLVSLLDSAAADWGWKEHVSYFKGLILESHVQHLLQAVGFGANGNNGRSIAKILKAVLHTCCKAQAFEAL